MRIFWTILLGGLMVVAGCHSSSDAHAPKAAGATKKGKTKPTMTQDLALRGTVSMVNPRSRSVILSFPVGWIPAVDRRLNVYRDGLKIGEVRITGPQMDTNIAADLMQGDARPGDMVRED
jgi:hypothetical protein